MLPEEHKEIVGTVQLKLSEDPDEIAWFDEQCDRLLPIYKKHLSQTKQLEEFIELYQTGQHEKLRKILQSHDSLPDLFLLCLHYSCRDPKVDASISAQILHAKDKIQSDELVTLYRERLLENPKLSQREFARSQNKRLNLQNVKDSEAIKALQMKLEALKHSLSEVEVGDSGSRSQIRGEIKNLKSQIATAKSKLIKPYAVRTIEGWLSVANADHKAN